MSFTPSKNLSPDPIDAEGETVEAESEITYSAVDPATGQASSEVTVASSSPGFFRTIGANAVAVGSSGPDDAGIPPSISVLDVTDAGKSSVRWTRAQGENEAAVPQWVTRAADVVVGWTDLPDEGDGVIAYDLSDGSIAWTGKTSSFDNTPKLVEGNDHVAMVHDALCRCRCVSFPVVRHRAKGSQCSGNRSPPLDRS